MSIPPPLPQKKPKQSVLGIIALLIALLGGLLAVVLPSAIDAPPPMNIQILFSTIIATVFMAVGMVLGLIVLAGRGPRAIGACAAVLNLVLAVVMGMRAFKAGPVVFTSLGEQVKSQAAARQSSNADASDEGVAMASLPIPQKADTMSWKEVVPLYEQWISENMDAPYAAHGIRDVRWDANVQLLIRVTNLALVQAPGARSWKEIAALGKKITDAGCTDPLTLYLVSLSTNDPSRKLELLQSAAAGLKSRGYPASVVFMAQADIYGLAPGDTGPCFQALQQALSEHPLTPGDCYVWNFLLGLTGAEKLLQQHGEEECKLVEAIPGVDGWLKHRLRGSYEIYLAWQARGTGWGNTITKEGGQGFEQHLAAADRELTESWRLNPKHFGAATEMIQVSMGEGDVQKMRMWFDRAVEARFGYLGAYSAMRWGLRARWLGSEKAILAFGKTCAATKRYDTTVPWELLLAVKDDASDAPDAAVFYSRHAPWPELQEMFEGYLSDPDSKGWRKYYLSTYAIVAAKCGKKDVCLKQLDELKSKLDERAASEWKLDPAVWPAQYQKQVQ